MSSSLRLRRASVVTILAGLAAIGLGSASSAAPTDLAWDGDGPPRASDVVRIRRGGGGPGSVEATRGAKPESPEADDVGHDTSGGAGVGDGELTAEQASRLAAGGAPDGALTAEQFILADIGVRGERSGRLISLVGAEVVFADCAIDVDQGVEVGFAGVIGQLGSSPGATRVVSFTLERGGDVTLTIQPPAANRATPSRPVRTVTMVVP